MDSGLVDGIPSNAAANDATETLLCDRSPNLKCWFELEVRCALKIVLSICIICYIVSLYFCMIARILSIFVKYQMGIYIYIDIWSILTNFVHAMFN